MEEHLKDLLWKFGVWDDLTDAQHVELEQWLTAHTAAAVEETEKAYGGCTKCYGKGYATWRHGETYHGSTHNMRNDIKFCDCDRGKQLESLMGVSL